MLSDDSSSDSETGRFKCRTNTQDEQNNKHRSNKFRPEEGKRHTDNDRIRRDIDKKRDERNNYRDRQRQSRPSPVSRRRYSRDRSPYKRRSPERRYNRNSRGRSNAKDHRSDSRERQRQSRNHRQPEYKRDLKEEIKRNLSADKITEKSRRKSRDKSPSSAHKIKQSVVQKPPPNQPRKRKSESPIIIEEHENVDEVQPGSYYSMIPAVIKDKTEESSEIDSSDDEKLRAKLLNLEKELHKTKKRKHKKKHKRKSSKSSKERDHGGTAVEVSSTTDIEDKSKIDISIKIADTAVEVTSTQKSIQKESSEEGEITTDDDSQNDIDPTDLRHKLRKSTQKGNSQETKTDVCGPALPPHLRKQSRTPDLEGPALPPHLKRSVKNIGPSIPDDLRKVLAESDREVMRYESSDDGEGYGPVPVGVGGHMSEAQQRLEERALELKIKNIDGHGNDSKVKSREQWMLELPEAKAKYLGLEARSFRAKQGPDMSDRSSWTDTPEDKARKATGQVKDEDLDEALKREAKARHIASRDVEQEAVIKKHKKKHKREESLLEIHQKKLKKKKKKEDNEEGKKERRPFSRDIDLQANRFDEAQKKSIIKKAQELNSRFSRGEAKYL